VWASQEEAEMPRRVVAHRMTDSFDLVEVPAPNEHHLQEVVKAHPQLIPADDLGLDGDLLVVGRETTLASGAIDLLCLAWSGDLVLVEFKTGPQNPDFRHALAQVIDYGSDLWRLSYEDFDRGVVQRHLSKHPLAQPPARNLDDAIERAWALNADERAALEGRLGEVLATGDFIFVVAAQRFTPAMVGSLDYLNTTMRRGRFYLVEVVHLAGRDLTAHAAQVVAAPPSTTATSANGSSTQANEADFLQHIPAHGHRDALRDVFARCATLGLLIHWGSKGASIRLPTRDRVEPLSVGWAFLEGGQWQGAKHLTLGADPASLKQTPALRSPSRRSSRR
jgi:Endonuclease NucS